MMKQMCGGRLVEGSGKGSPPAGYSGIYNNDYYYFHGTCNNARNKDGYGWHLVDGSYDVVCKKCADEFMAVNLTTGDCEECNGLTKV